MIEIEMSKRKALIEKDDDEFNSDEQSAEENGDDAVDENESEEEEAEKPKSTAKKSAAAPKKTKEVETKSKKTAAKTKEPATTDKKKKTTAKSSPSSSKKEKIVDLGNNRKVSYSTFTKDPRIDIREFYTKDGESLPGKKACKHKFCRSTIVFFTFLIIGFATRSFMFMIYTLAKDGALKLSYSEQQSLEFLKILPTFFFFTALSISLFACILLLKHKVGTPDLKIELIRKFKIYVAIGNVLMYVIALVLSLLEYREDHSQGPTFVEDPTNSIFDVALQAYAAGIYLFSAIVTLVYLLIYQIKNKTELEAVGQPSEEFANSWLGKIDSDDEITLLQLIKWWFSSLCHRNSYDEIPEKNLSSSTTPYDISLG
ncbi:hypothetical protein PPL_09911 [Heterostelium album PN500]|uniref:Transcriptional coactivator p15 (PC4) C-terminal domain-containing protein n=1 Tax=Heterostelium pallidum (strain ATCC 26659 / Pp 5 / PN500) TaxID=670386 RepID=D3BPP4_HETP5|nr:hypothetical protein PPL_09911 [Heterostelium album PN500]EFA76606.1 hypothetical protein PPL_09911 [Heterostelium album PN500]|eukprot:XP_020428738.1 hypothetical protein PPL_09911 [Heterostelium album PN500]